MDLACVVVVSVVCLSTIGTYHCGLEGFRQICIFIILLTRQLMTIF